MSTRPAGRGRTPRAKSSNGTLDSLAFLRSGTAKAVFEQYGFTFLVRPTS